MRLMHLGTERHCDGRTTARSPPAQIGGEPGVIYRRIKTFKATVWLDRHDMSKRAELTRA